MSHDLSWSKHITQITCNAYRILGLLRRSFSAINNSIIHSISSSTNPTRSGSHRKLIQPIVKTTRHKNFYFSRLPLLWNSLPPIDLDSSYDTIKRKLKDIFWLSFVHNFNSEIPCTYHFCCPCNKCSLVPKSNFQIE